MKKYRSRQNGPSGYSPGTMPRWIFVLGGAAAVVIALLTVSFQAIRAATANPVATLRSE
jgi:putative ABC transport system permease protein